MESATDTQINAFGLASWSRQRSIDELRSFIESRHSALPDNLDIE